MLPPAPALIIRQQPPKPETPEPLVIREVPPPVPPKVGKKLISISGKKLPPPARKVIVERLPKLPSKPQPVIIERWLTYPEIKRKVIYRKPAEEDPIFSDPKNVIIQWETPQAEINKELKYLGVVKADPTEYVKKYGKSLKKSNELPDYVLDIETPEGLNLASSLNNKKPSYDLEGDIEALKLIDLDKEGLSEYKS